jgi:hypothetical protein
MCGVIAPFFSPAMIKGMGASLHTLNVRAGGKRRPPLVHAFSVRVSMSKDGGWTYLQYIRPNGMPVWSDSKTNYVSRLNHFESAQRLCRELFGSPQFPPGTRVQFYKQFFRPTPHPSDPRGEVHLVKMSEKAVRDSTVQKPHGV